MTICNVKGDVIGRSVEDFRVFKVFVLVFLLHITAFVQYFHQTVFPIAADWAEGKKLSVCFLPRTRWQTENKVLAAKKDQKDQNQS